MTIFIKRLKYQEAQLGQILCLLLECSINFSVCYSNFVLRIKCEMTSNPYTASFLLSHPCTTIPSDYWGVFPAFIKAVFVSTGLQLTHFCPTFLYFIFFKMTVIFTKYQYRFRSLLRCFKDLALFRHNSLLYVDTF